MNYLLLLIGFLILILGGNWLLKAAVALSLRLGIPKIVIGMTVVSFATSAPELIVSLKSALDGHADIALGNVIGSNIANIGLVLGIVTLVSTINIEKSFYIIDWPIMMLSSVLFYFFLSNDGLLECYEGLILFSLLIIFLVYLFKFQKPAVVDEMSEDDKKLPIYLTLIYLALGAVGLWGGSGFLIDGAVNLAHDFEVEERIIGITIISIGTSIPELAASLVAVIKKEKAISIGNIIGSNIFNILAVMGLTSMITPIQVIDQGLLTFDIFWMLYFAIIILPLVFTPGRMKLGWKEGLIFLGSYIAFLTLLL
jgi:cation:H+ antiporter